MIIIYLFSLLFFFIFYIIVMFLKVVEVILLSDILPFIDKFHSHIGNFIKPDGSIISLNVTHEEFSKDYCRGESYFTLIKKKSYDYSEYLELLNCFSVLYHRDLSWGEYITSHLTKEEFLSYLAWEREHPYDSTGFLIQVLGWDKIESLSVRSITTSCPNPHVRFYNYYLMDWEIYSLDKLKYDQETSSFISSSIDEFSIQSKNDVHYDEELVKIKKNIKSLEVRSAYLKK